MNKTILILIVGVISMTLMSFEASAAESVDIDTSTVRDGYVNIKLNTGRDNGVAVYIKVNGNDYYYGVYNNTDYVGYLLPEEEEGTFLVTLYEKTAKDKYRKLSVESFVLYQYQIDDDAKKIFKGHNVVSWQMDSGGWGKNNKELFIRAWNGSEKRSPIVISGVEYATIDNGATVPELKFISEVMEINDDKRFKEAAKEGVGFLTEMQYETGAYPQIYPLRVNDDRWPYFEMGTYNDDAMIMVLQFFKDIVDGIGYTNIVDEKQLKDVVEALELGVEYILNTQIEVDGELTAWCAQHDPYTFEPVKARSFELASISGYESVRIVQFLISLGNEDERVVQAVESAINWYKKVGTPDIKYDRYAKSGTYFKKSKGATLWYRFYEIGTNKGFYSNYDGIKVYDILEVKEERRHGYVWAGDWGKKIVGYEYK